MARSKNQVSIIGMVGNDAEARQTVQGLWYARISVATSTGGYKKADGTEVKEVTQWHRVVVWNKLAEFAGKFVKKGMKVAVDGMLVYGSYQSQQGVEVKTAEISASEMILMTPSQALQEQDRQSQVHQMQQAAPMQQNEGCQQVQQSRPTPNQPQDDLPF